MRGRDGSSGWNARQPTPANFGEFEASPLAGPHRPEITITGHVGAPYPKWTIFVYLVATSESQVAELCKAEVQLEKHGHLKIHLLQE